MLISLTVTLIFIESSYGTLFLNITPGKPLKRLKTLRERAVFGILFYRQERGCQLPWIAARIAAQRKLGI